MSPPSPKYLALDLWDTILRRRCHPDEVKLFTAQRMIFLLASLGVRQVPTPFELLRQRQDVEYCLAMQNRDQGFDDEYEIHEVLVGCLEQVAGKSLTQEEKVRLCDALVSSEIDHEIDVSYPDQELVRFVREYSADHHILISDFYMSADRISHILAAKKIPFSFDAIFVSCESRLNKKSGRLFGHVVSKLGILPSNLLHVGDDPHADVAMAARAGLQTYHFIGGQNHRQRLDNAKFFTSRDITGQSVGPLLQDRLRSQVRSSDGWGLGNPLFIEGVELAILFTGFALYIDEICRRTGVDQVHFFTREGIFFKQVFDLLQALNPYRLPPLRSRLLPVSRIATFFPSLRQISCSELMRMWSQYSEQSMQMMFSSLGLDTDPYLDCLHRHGLEPDEIIVSPWLDQRVVELFADQDFVQLLEEERQRREQALRLFCRAKKFGTDSKAVIVDIGWRGTIQDNLAYIFPGMDITGIYLGLQEFFNTQPENTRKHAFLANANQGDSHPILHHVMPLEMLCFETGGSAVGYRLGSHGHVEVMYEADEQGDRFHRRWISSFQAGVLAGVEQLCHLVRQHGLGVQELREIGKEQAARLICEPPPAICRAFFALRQDDTFGMNRVIYPGESRFRLRDKVLSYFSPTRRHRFLHDLEASGWPQGLLRYRYGGIFYYLGRFKNRIPGL